MNLKTEGEKSPIIIGNKNRTNISNRKWLTISLTITLTISLVLAYYYFQSRNQKIQVETIKSNN